MIMGLFDDGEHNDMGDLFNQLPGGIWRGMNMIWKIGCKPMVKNIQKVRADAAMRRAINEMLQKIQSPDAPAERPAAVSSSVAAADLSPPMKRKSGG